MNNLSLLESSVQLQSLSDKRLEVDANKKQIIQNINIDPVKLELVHAYQFGYRGQLKQTGRSSKDKEKCGIIIGYKLKNVDTKPLNYLKCEYTIKGIETHKEIAEPGEEFIITRDDLKYLMIQNGRKLENANIRLRSGHAAKLLSNDNKVREIIRRSSPRQSGGSITTTFYAKHVLMHGTFIDNKFIQRDNLPYIQFKRNSGKSIRESKYCKTISKNIGTNIKLLNTPENKRYFYWVDDRYLLYKYKKYLKILDKQQIIQAVDSLLAKNSSNINYYGSLSLSYNNGNRNVTFIICVDPRKQRQSNMQRNIKSALKGLANRILNEDGGYDKSSLGRYSGFFKEILAQSLYGDNNINSNKICRQSLVYRRNMGRYNDLESLESIVKNGETYDKHINLVSRIEIPRYKGIQFDSVKVIGNLESLEIDRQTNKYRLAGYVYGEYSTDDLIYYTRKINDYKYSIAVLQRGQTEVRGLYTLLKDCKYIENLEFKDCTVRLTSLRKTFRSMPNKIGTLYIDKVSIPGGVTMYSSKNVKNPGNKVIDFIVNDDKLKQIAAKHGYDPKDRYDFAIDSIINDAFAEVKIKFSNISDRQLYIIRNMLRCGIFDSKIFDLITQLNLIDELDALEIYKSGAMRVLEDCAYKISLYTVSQMFDNLGKETKVITTNKYVEVANKRRLQLKN